MPHENESHACGNDSCTNNVQYDDEKYCYEHSPDSGSYVPGYSYKATHPAK